MKLFLGINVLEHISARPYLSHLSFMGDCHKDFPGIQIYTYTPYRCSIDRMRNESARMALEFECDYLMFIDDDVIVESHTLKSLINANADIAMAETYVRGMPFNAMFFTYVDGKLEHLNEYEHLVDEQGLIRVDAVGFSCVLIKCDLLRKLSTPYFVTGPNFTEDVYFCVKAQHELGKDNVSMVVDTKVPTGHEMMPGIVTRDNVKLLRQFTADEDKAIKLGDTKALQKSIDRGNEYTDVITEMFDVPAHDGLEISPGG